MSKKNPRDIWNEITKQENEITEIKSHQFQQNVRQNPEGISAEFAKYPLDETSTPKVLQPNKRD